MYVKVIQIEALEYEVETRVKLMFLMVQHLLGVLFW